MDEPNETTTDTTTDTDKDMDWAAMAAAIPRTDPKKEHEKEFRSGVNRSRYFDRLTRAEMHELVDAEVTQIETEATQVEAARTRSRTLTTMPLVAEAWYHPHYDAFRIRYSWFGEDSHGCGASLEEAGRWFKREELEAIKAAELAVLAAATTPE